MDWISTSLFSRRCSHAARCELDQRTEHCCYPKFIHSISYWALSMVNTRSIVPSGLKLAISTSVCLQCFPSRAIESRLDSALFNCKQSTGTRLLDSTVVYTGKVPLSPHRELPLHAQRHPRMTC